MINQSHLTFFSFDEQIENTKSQENQTDFLGKYYWNVNCNLDTVCTGELSHASCQQTTSKYWPRINLARTNMNWDEHSVKKTPWVEIHINKTEFKMVSLHRAENLYHFVARIFSDSNRDILCLYQISSAACLAENFSRALNRGKRQDPHRCLASIVRNGMKGRHT